MDEITIDSCWHCGGSPEFSPSDAGLDDVVTLTHTCTWTDPPDTYSYGGMTKREAIAFWNEHLSKEPPPEPPS